VAEHTRRVNVQTSDTSFCVFSGELTGYKQTKASNIQTIKNHLCTTDGDGAVDVNLMDCEGSMVPFIKGTWIIDPDKDLLTRLVVFEDTTAVGAAVVVINHPLMSLV